MVRINRIYTGTGDDGTTGLGDGQRVPKDQVRITAYGTVDELSSVLGVLMTLPGVEPVAAWVRQIQNDLFDLGADLAVPGKGGERLRITPEYVKRLESWIDEANEGLEPLKSFVLPGGHPLAAWMHMARTVCRRAERWVVTLTREEPERTGLEPLHYLNRLSDLFFVLSRRANDGGKLDVLWRPGGQEAK
ncbi:MAG: cob(I)yrinic acid a,c-diamide adenosyltransferase [Planctomycetes bacterium]|nr:cob(I)yrinic acid a,c-diamide adenosyltransferase [Planctomycetota bacterium]HPF13599.1 cob(I)yrinic acid a,c-diamide adenosyltransferase [Planctomycetota bacterium]HRV81717.1 cob(I)yrinic acid a,c-diamide adenosyltransferase [Planctomycetota bacterium]